jgi:hypothetical protein
LNEARNFSLSKDYPMRIYCAEIILHYCAALQG